MELGKGRREAHRAGGQESHRDAFPLLEEKPTESLGQNNNALGLLRTFILRTLGLGNID